MPEWITGTVVAIAMAAIPTFMSNAKVELMGEWLGDKFGLFAIKVQPQTGTFVKLLAWVWNTLPHLVIGFGRGYAKRMGVAL